MSSSSRATGHGDAGDESQTPNHWMGWSQRHEDDDDHDDDESEDDGDYEEHVEDEDDDEEEQDDDDDGDDDDDHEYAGEFGSRKPLAIPYCFISTTLTPSTGGGIELEVLIEELMGESEDQGGGAHGQGAAPAQRRIVRIGGGTHVNQALWLIDDGNADDL